MKNRQAGSNLLSLIFFRIESNILINDVLVESYQIDIEALSKQVSTIIGKLACPRFKGWSQVENLNASSSKRDGRFSFSYQ